MHGVIIESPDFTVVINDSPEKRSLVFDKLVSFFVEHSCFSGESYCQSDAPQLGAVEFMSDMLDETLKPLVTWKE